MTAPLAAFPLTAPIAAPFAAPLALGWELLLGVCRRWWCFGDRLHCPVVAFLSCEVGFAEPNIQTSWRIHLDGITS